MSTENEATAVLAVAGSVRADGSVFTKEALRKAAEEHEHMTFDEATGRLIYCGPPPEERKS